MRLHLLGPLAALLLAPAVRAVDAPQTPPNAAKPAWVQTNLPVPKAERREPPVADAPVVKVPDCPEPVPYLGADADPDTSDEPVNCWWAEGEYLMWWVRDPRVGLPLATTGPADSRGILGAAGTTVLRDDQNFNYGLFNGMRFRVGRWFSDTSACGVEVSGFLLEQKGEDVTVASGPTGAPLLARPFVDATTGAGNSRLVAFPDGSTGRIDASTNSRLWGAEVNLVTRVGQWCDFSLVGLAGFRYLHLEEDLTLSDRSSLFSNLVSTSFNGAPVANPATTAIVDRFTARNQFYGGQVGAVLSYWAGALGVDVTTKVALGSVHQVVSRGGSTTLLNGGVQSTNGGLFVQSSNAGRSTDDRFAVLPEVGVKLTYRLGRGVSLTGGYNYLFLSRVARPGDAVDAMVNPNLIPVSPSFGQGGPARPAPAFDRTNFDAHGVTVGLNVSF